MKSFKSFLTERFSRAYKMPEEEFESHYGRFKHIKNGIVTHVYDGTHKIAEYNHILNNLITDRNHEII